MRRGFTYFCITDSLVFYETPLFCFQNTLDFPKFFGYFHILSYFSRFCGFLREFSDFLGIFVFAFCDFLDFYATHLFFIFETQFLVMFINLIALSKRFKRSHQVKLNINLIYLLY